MATRRVHLPTRSLRTIAAVTAVLALGGGGLAASAASPDAVATPETATAPTAPTASPLAPAAIVPAETATVARTATTTASAMAPAAVVPAETATVTRTATTTAPEVTVPTATETPTAERPFTRADLMSARLPEEFGSSARFTNGTHSAGGMQVSLADPGAHWGPAQPIVAEFPTDSGTGLAAMVSVVRADEFPAAWILTWDADGTPLGGVRLPDTFEDRWEMASGLTWEGTALRARYSEVIDGDQQFGNITDHTVRVAVDHGRPVVERASHVAQDPRSVAGGLVEAVRTGDVGREVRIATPAARQVLDFSVEGGPTLRGLITDDAGGTFESCDVVQSWDGDAWVCGQRLAAPGDPSFGVFVERTAPFEWVVSDIDHLAMPADDAPTGE